MTSALYEVEFLLLVVSSLLLPLCIYALLLFKRSISQWTVLVLAVVLIALSGIDLILLQMLAAKARISTSTFDDRLFTTEIRIALYILPAVFASIGANLVSHVLIRHLNRAENQFEAERRNRRGAPVNGLSAPIEHDPDNVPQP